VYKPLAMGVGPVLVERIIFCEDLPNGPNLPPPGGKLRAADAEHVQRVFEQFGPGENGARQVGGPVIVALRQAITLGATARFVGAVGDDENGAFIKRNLADSALDIDDLVVQKGRRSGCSVAWVDRHGDRSILFDNGTLDSLESSAVGRLRTKSADTVHIDSDEPYAALALAEWSSRQGIAVHYDIDSWGSHTFDLLKATTTAQISIKELQTSSIPEGDPAERLRWLQSEFSLDVAILTMGPQGALACGPQDSIWDVPAYVVEARDSIGAGDVFSGCFEMARRRGATVYDALRFAAAGAALSSTQLGNGVLPTDAEILRLMDSRSGQSGT